MIIRQMEKKGKVNRRTWFALALMLLVVPLLFIPVGSLFPWKEIPDMQPDCDRGCNAPVFYDV